MRKGLLFLLVMMLAACKSIQYVPVETVKTEYITNTVHDSVFVEVEKNDCTIIETRHDTVFQTRWRTLYKDRWRDRLVTDTIIRTDSVQIPYPVERKLSAFEKFSIDYGKIMLGATIVLVVAAVVAIIRYIRRKR